MAKGIVIVSGLLSAAFCRFVGYKFYYNQISLTSFQTIKIWSGLA
jgi:hypothetical protein